MGNVVSAVSAAVRVLFTGRVDCYFAPMDREQSGPFPALIFCELLYANIVGLDLRHYGGAIPELNNLMRWILWIAIVLVPLLAAYTVWPLIGFYKIASAIESRNAAALAEQVDFPSLRRSVAHQVIAEYLKLTGKDKKLGRFGTDIATGVGASLAESLVAQYLNPETLLDLLTKGRAEDGAKVSTKIAPFTTSAWRNAWSVWWNSEYRGTDFYLLMPPEKSKDEQFRVRLSLRGWQWKVTGIDLPDALRMRLAQELLKQKQDPQKLSAP